MKLTFTCSDERVNQLQSNIRWGMRSNSLSNAGNAVISGIAGIGHILTGVGIILLLVSLKKIAGSER